MHDDNSNKTNLIKPQLAGRLQSTASSQIHHTIFSLPFQFQDFRFLCPNDTVFDQQNLVCTNWFEVDCQQSVALFLSDFGTKKLTAQGCCLRLCTLIQSSDLCFVAFS